MMVEAGGFHILLPLRHVSHFSHLLIYSKQSRLLLHLQDGIASLEPVHLWMEGRGKEGQDPKTGLKMEEKKETASIMDQYQQHRHPHPPNCHCTCPLPAISKTLFLFPPRSVIFLALIEVDFRSQPMRKLPSVSFHFHSFISHSITYYLTGRPCIPAKPTTPSRILRCRFSPFPEDSAPDAILSDSVCPPLSLSLWHLPCSNSLSVSCCCRCHSPLPLWSAPWQEALHSQLEMRTMQLSVIHSL